MFSQGEKDYNLKITKVLEDHGYEVFLPQRDGIEAAMLEGKSEKEKAEMIFEKDVSEIMKADILFMVLDGRVPDEGACVELGIGYANQKRCYGIKTDTRSIEIDLDLNPMISECFIKLFKDYDGEKLIEQLEQYLYRIGYRVRIDGVLFLLSSLSEVLELCQVSEQPVVQFFNLFVLFVVLALNKYGSRPVVRWKLSGLTLTCFCCIL